MRKSALFFIGTLGVCTLPAWAFTEIEVSNPLDFERVGELVEVPAAKLQKLVGEDFVIIGQDGRQVPYQLTYDGLAIFPVDIAPKANQTFKVIKGTPLKADTVAYGRMFPERDDDMTWENAHAAYRAYGPRLQARGERGFGYDIWCKSVNEPVIEKRYFKHLRRNQSFHKDHGDGLDVYSVGPTLGGGAAALMNDNGEILYPWCWKEYQILDRGPLRFTVLLTYPETEVGPDKIVEKRLISLDANSWLNKTVLTYDNLSAPRTVVQGTVVHTDNPEARFGNPDCQWVAYEDLTDNPNASNGKIYVGIVPTVSSELTLLPTEGINGVVGHAAALSKYTPGKPLTYYWGSGWSKGGVTDMDNWIDIMTKSEKAIKHPLKVKITK